MQACCEDNVYDKLKGRSNPLNRNVLWTERITRKNGHLYHSSPFAVNLLRAQLERLHKRFVYPPVKSLFEILKRALPDEAKQETQKLPKNVCSECATCQTTADKPLHFRVSAISENDAKLKFNQQVDLNLFWLNSNSFLHDYDHDNRFSTLQILKGETTLHVWESFLTSWSLDISRHAGTNSYWPRLCFLRARHGRTFSSKWLQTWAHSY
jgi:hypothetical protein